MNSMCPPAVLFLWYVSTILLDVIQENGVHFQLLFFGTGGVVHRQRFDIEVGAILRLMPIQILSHQALGIQLHAVQNYFLELFVTSPVNEVTAMEILGLVIHDPRREFLPVLQHA